MADRNAPASFTFEEWRVEFNELSTDVGDIAILPSTIGGTGVTDVIEAIGALNTSLSANDLDFSGNSGSNGSVTDSQVLDFQGTANQITTTSDGSTSNLFLLQTP